MKHTITLYLLFFTALIASAQMSSDSLVLYLPFNGNANDLSGHNNNGIVYGATLTNDRFGNANSAYYFDGNSYISFSNNTNVESPSTITLWFKLDKYTGQEGEVIISKYYAGVPSESEMFFRINVDSVLAFTTNGSNVPYGYNTIKDTSIIINNDEWYFISSTINDDIATLYINGEKVASDSLPKCSLTSSELKVGAYSNINSLHTQSYFNGSIDDIRIFNKVLTLNEIKSLYTEGTCQRTIYDTVRIMIQDTIIIHDTISIYDTITIKNFITVYDTVSVTDTLLIDAVITGLDSNTKKNTLKVYPNPTKDYIYINTGNFTDMQDYQITIFNSAGVTMFYTKISDPLYEINLSQWTGKGIYFIKITDPQNNEVDTKKIILQ